MSHHFARLASSERMQRVYEALKSGPKTTKELARLGRTCAPGSAVSELRRNGFIIRCDFLGRYKDGTRVYKYTLC